MYDVECNKVIHRKSGVQNDVDVKNHKLDFKDSVL
jgi:hypothetical protein